MESFFIFLHIGICVFLVLSVLLQVGKGSDMGAVFGGSSSTIFGTTGATTFITKVTTVLAILFVVSSVYLTVSKKQKLSVFEGVKTETTTPVVTPPAPPEEQKKN
ncbi:MAG: preprotein translocase subunit SecG [Deltaproteobacteria bacterium]|nr:preprotein translocase subunit SecG [Deltaproteobacteria bacterium]